MHDCPELILRSGRRVTYYTEEFVAAKLEAAGRTLMMMRESVKPQGFKSFWPDVVHDWHEAYGWHALEDSMPTPTAKQISNFYAVMDWHRYIAGQTDRRIVLLRALIHPVNDRHIFTWRRLGQRMGMDHKTVQRMWKDAIRELAAGLNREEGDEK